LKSIQLMSPTIIRASLLCHVALRASSHGTTGVTFTSDTDYQIKQSIYLSSHPHTTKHTDYTHAIAGALSLVDVNVTGGIEDTAKVSGGALNLDVALLAPLVAPAVLHLPEVHAILGAVAHHQHAVV